MKFSTTSLPGLTVIDLDRFEDERGYFARSFCTDEFAEQGLINSFVQSNVSFNHKAGTLRGMHDQVDEHREAKLVRCTSGAIFDVAVDVRADSSTFGQYFSIELSSASNNMLYIPKGFAHGFQALADKTEVLYQMSDAYVPNAAAGFRYDDPAVNIPWPLPVSVISQADLNLPLLNDAYSH